MTTRQLENDIFRALTKMGTYLCFEVAMPGKYRGANVVERVDLLTYDTKGDWRFYELKITKSDFYSKNKVTFKGHFNYYVLPIELYEKVKNDIPHGVGVYTAQHLNDYDRIIVNCKKKAKRRELAVNEDKLQFAFMQSLSREHGKYRRLLDFMQSGKVGKS